MPPARGNYPMLRKSLRAVNRASGPQSGPEAIFTARKHYYVTEGSKSI